MTAHTSHSKIGLIRKCKRAAYYKYEEKIVRKRPFPRPLVGTILHEMTDAWIKARMIDEYTNDPWKVLAKFKKQYDELFREQREEYGDIPHLCEKIFEGYLRRWREDGLEYIASEVEGKTELMKGVELIFIIDAIVMRKKTGMRFLLERKFHARIPDAQDRFSDLQTLLYFEAYNRECKKGEELNGIIWDYGRMKAPTVPQTLVKGGLSQASNIDTDSFTYLQAIKDNGLKAGDYREMLEKLTGKEQTFFQRVDLPAPPKAMIQEIWNDARETTRDWQQRLLTQDSLENPFPRDGMSMFTCKGCEYRTVCEAEIRGLDASFVRKRDYKPKEERDVDGNEEE